MRKTPPTEPLMLIVATHDELTAINLAITYYTNWLARTPEGAAEQRETIVLLDRFRHRLAQSAALNGQSATMR